MCADCLYHFPFFDTPRRPELPALGDSGFPVEVYALYSYRRGSNYRKLVHALKYRHRKALGLHLGEWLGERLVMSADGFGADLIIPLPLHPRRLRSRGFNQSQLVAAGIAAKTGIPVEANAVVRVRNNPSQTGLTPLQRAENTEGLFQVSDPLLLKNRHLLLVDDVITTGSTMRACIASLRQVPGVRVSVASLGLAEGNEG